MQDHWTDGVCTTSVWNNLELSCGAEEKSEEKRHTIGVEVTQSRLWVTKCQQPRH